MSRLPPPGRPGSCVKFTWKSSVPVSWAVNADDVVALIPLDQDLFHALALVRVPDVVIRLDPVHGNAEPGGVRGVKGDVDGVVAGVRLDQDRVVVRPGMDFVRRGLGDV